MRAVQSSTGGVAAGGVVEKVVHQAPEGAASDDFTTLSVCTVYGVVADLPAVPAARLASRRGRGERGGRTLTVGSGTTRSDDCWSEELGRLQGGTGGRCRREQDPCSMRLHGCRHRCLTPEGAVDLTAAVTGSRGSTPRTRRRTDPRPAPAVADPALLALAVTAPAGKWIRPWPQPPAGCGSGLPPPQPGELPKLRSGPAGRRSGLGGSRPLRCHRRRPAVAAAAERWGGRPVAQPLTAPSRR